ncbi:hypothetical protein JMK10_07185 [Rhodovulum sulfidophilum]|uniref:hypothetical protein n=1 Tax=Rhodovulum sulfidophilum TaxID=35806 RepID=UPI0019216ECA|nr:hypothetical protein [Rhodovulum sulfidophilum]MBL3572517.1 hypothetical protein [Rhodovulum sulfidophilum]MCE8432289.1 hypothetical protein [Rhodovulum sulfidophilum]MCF4116594.1 hypothetical protein [Rhodovulum sulfidophilum]
MPRFMARRSLLAALPLLFLGACVQTGPMGSMAPGVIGPVAPGSIWAGRIGRVTGSDGMVANPLWTAEFSEPGFRSDLASSLTRAGILTPGGANRLNADVESVTQPQTGTKVQVTMVVHYTIHDATGRTLFDQTVTTSYTSPLGQAVRGIDRLRIASENAARDNIALLLRALGASAEGAPTGGPF